MKIFNVFINAISRRQGRVSAQRWINKASIAFCPRLMPQTALKVFRCCKTLNERIRPTWNTELQIMESSFGERLAYALEIRGLTQGNLAELLGSSPTFISSLVKGKKNAGYAYLVRVSKELNLDMNWLMLGKGEMDLPTSLNDFTIPKSSFKETNPNVTYLLSRLKELAITQREIAENLGVSFATVSNTIHFRGKSHSVAVYISGLLGEDIQKLWPDTYVFKARKKSTAK